MRRITPANLADFRLMHRVVAVSLPLMGTMAGNLFVMLIDRICLARYSPDTLAASGPAVFTAMTIIMLFTATANISRAYVAQSFGRSGEASARSEAFMGILNGGALALLLLTLSPLMRVIPTWSDRPQRVVELESQFLAWAAVFGAVMVINVALAAYFNAIGRTRLTLRTALIGQGVAGVMIYGLVFGRFGLPEMGMRGSALGTLASACTILCCYLCSLPRRFFRDGFSYWRESGWTHARSQAFMRLRRGLSSGLAAGADELGITAFVWLAAMLGPVALAANNINLTLNYLAIIPILGLGMGCSILCANAIGRGAFEDVTHILRITLLVEAAYTALVAMLQVWAPDVLLRPFGLPEGDMLLRDVSLETARILWTYAVAFMLSMTGASILESFGLTRFVLILRIVAVWCVSIPSIYFFAQRRGDDPHSLPQIWLIGSAFELLIGLIYIGRLMKAARGRQNYLHGESPPSPSPLDASQPAVTPPTAR